MKKLNETANELSRAELVKLKENWIIINENFEEVGKAGPAAVEAKNIAEAARATANAIKGTADGAKAIADTAKSSAEAAKNTAENAKSTSLNVQSQLSQLVVEGDSSPQAAQASVGTDGTIYPSLKERLDAEQQAAAAQLADMANGTTMISRGDLTPFILSHGRKILITGDSLSFNRHPFAVFTGNNNAYDYKPGMLSWSHMVRDAIHRADEYFISVKDLLMRTKTTAAKFNYFPNASAYTLAFNGIVAELQTTSNTEEFILLYRHANRQTNKAYVHMAHNPLNNACSFDVYVDNVFVKNVNNNGVGKAYQGLDSLVIELTVPADNQYHEIKLTNFIQTAATPDSAGNRMLFLYGIGSKLTNIYLTGQGGTTSQWMRENLQERILQYSPDIVFLVEGANDLFQNFSVETYRNNMQAIITAIRANNPRTEIVLLSTTQMSDYPLSQILPFADVTRELAQVNNCYFIDLVRLFANLDPTLWRIDNVHMSIFGNDILVNTAMDLVFKGANYPKELMSGNEAVYIQNKKFPVPYEPAGYGRIQYSSTTGAFTIPFQSSEGLIVSAARVGNNQIKLVFKANTVMTIDGAIRNGFLYDISIKPFATSGNVPGLTFDIVVGGWDKNEAVINLKKAGGVALTDADWSTYANDFKFVVSY